MSFKEKIIETYDKHYNKFIWFVGICLLIAFISGISFYFLSEYKVNNIDRELSHRLLFCQDKNFVVDYINDCSMTGQCSKIYLDCEYINFLLKHQSEFTNDKGVYDLNKIETLYEKYQYDKAHSFGNLDDFVVPINLK